MKKNDRARKNPLSAIQAGSARTTAIMAALLLFLAGTMTGVALDRFWFHHMTGSPAPLTVDAMATDLELSETEARRVRDYLDQMRPVLMEAAQEGPESLHATTQRIHQRLQELLPQDARPRFRHWLQRHRHGMMRHMRNGNRNPDSTIDEDASD